MSSGLLKRRRLYLATVKSLPRGYCTGKLRPERAVVTLTTARSALGKKGPVGPGDHVFASTVTGAGPGVSSLIPYLAYRRRNGRGAHQLARPSSRMVAGTSSTRTTVASTSSATIMPTP